MAVCHVCDRCGELYGTTDALLNCGEFTFYKKAMPNEYYDLCPDCAQLLIEWIKQAIINRMDQTRKGRLIMWKDYFRKEQKEKVWRLHCDGLSISQISDRLKIAVPTVSRWISEREKEEG